MKPVLRLPAVKAATGYSKETIYAYSRNKGRYGGLFVPSIRLGLKAVGWFEHEVDAIMAARAAGKSNDYIRQLVRDLIAARSEAA